jgi:hypothetical protein
MFDSEPALTDPRTKANFTSTVGMPGSSASTKTANVKHDNGTHRIGGAIGDISWALICLSLPMLVLSAILIGLVYGYKISNNASSSSDILGVRQQQDSSAYYIDYSATRLATVSSWTSTAVSFTTSFIMVLAAYPIAKSYLVTSQRQNVNALPTSYQLSLIIGLLAGGLGPIWSWFLYFVRRKRTKHTKLLWLATLSVLSGLAMR